MDRPMFFTDAAPTVYFDVDSTLVFTEQECPELGDVYCVVIGKRPFYAHAKHVEHIKDFHARGHNIIVWSQGGALWARQVVLALGIEDIITACLSKPQWVFDDKPIEAWLCDKQRSYVNP
jgi:hypothetical protein